MRSPVVHCLGCGGKCTWDGDYWVCPRKSCESAWNSEAGYRYLPPEENVGLVSIPEADLMRIVRRFEEHCDKRQISFAWRCGASRARDYAIRRAIEKGLISRSAYGLYTLTSKGRKIIGLIDRKG